MGKNDGHPDVDSDQAIRDRHYAENGVDAEGNAPKGKQFDEEGNDAGKKKED